MNEAMVISRGWGMANAGEALALPGSISADTAKQLSGSAEVLMRTTYSLLEDCILAAIEKRSAADFTTWRATSFPQYLHAVLGLPALIKLAVPYQVIERLNREFFCELECDLREKGLSAFGAAVRDQAVFTAWTLRRISELISQVPAEPGAVSDQAARLIGEFIGHAIWTRFHLHCLVTAMRVNRPIYPEPLEVIMGGLRAAVNAYALARRLVDSIAPLPAPKQDMVVWDEEDEGLLAEATADMISENL